MLIPDESHLKGIIITEKYNYGTQEDLEELKRMITEDGVSPVNNKSERTESHQYRQRKTSSEMGGHVRERDHKKRATRDVGTPGDGDTNMEMDYEFAQSKDKSHVIPRLSKG